MPETYIDLLDYAKGLYEKALQLLAPGKCDNFSVISGSIILMVGLEKLTKSVIHKINPLMILIDKADFDDLIKHGQGDKFANRNTISFEKALERVIKLYPNLKTHQKDIKSIIGDRNILMHNFGYLDIGSLEKKIQIKVADFTEGICKECFESEPGGIIGQETWVTLHDNRDAYKNSEALELTTRINHLKRLLAQGEILPCNLVSIPKDKAQTFIHCPVCGEKALVAFDIDWDIDVDHREGVILGAYPSATPVILNCGCGFTLQSYEELEIVLGEKYDNICDEVIQQINECEERGKDS